MLNIGEIVTIADKEWIILDKNDGTVMCFSKTPFERMRFDTNNYAESNVHKYLHRNVLPTIIAEVGEDALFGVEIDLTSEDGLKDYGCVVNKIGLLTASMYRAYSEVIEAHNMRHTFWLSTPWSMSRRCGGTYNCVATSNGNLFSESISDYYAIHPFCVIKESALESLKE